jgi:hypothetical protein
VDEKQRLLSESRCSEKRGLEEGSERKYWERLEESNREVEEVVRVGCCSATK